MESPIENQSILFLLSIIYFYGGHPFFKGTIRELRDKTIELMSLVTITVTIAYIYSVMTLIEGEMTIIPIELAIIINIILFGRWLEKSLTKNITEPIRKLIKSIPSEANLIKNGKIKKIPTETIKPGDLILVKKGETIPADGIIIKGSTTIQPLTRKPIKKDIGETVTAASINIKSPIAIEVTKVGRKSFISQIIKLLTKKRKNPETRIRRQNSIHFHYNNNHSGDNHIHTLEKHANSTRTCPSSAYRGITTRHQISSAHNTLNIRNNPSKKWYNHKK